MSTLPNKLLFNEDFIKLHFQIVKKEGIFTDQITGLSLFPTPCDYLYLQMFAAVL